MNRYIADAWSLYDTIVLDIEHYGYIDMGWFEGWEAWEGYVSLSVFLREDKLILRVSLDVDLYSITNYMEGIRIWFKSKASCPRDNSFEIELRPELELELHTDRHESCQCLFVI